MAADLHRGDLLISSLLLNQDDVINNYDGDSSFGNSSGSSSGVSSPFSRSEGTPNSSVDEDEDEEYLAELSRQMAHFMLQEDEDKRTRTRSAVPSMPYQKPHTWAWDSDVSPRTQSSSSVWGAPLVQSHGCANWDVPYDVADKFEKMELNMDKKFSQHRRGYGEHKIASSDQNNPYVHNFVQFFSDDEVRAHVMKHQMQSASISRNKQPKSIYAEQDGGGPPRASATPPLGAALKWQQQLQLQQTQSRAGSGLRAVFLGGSGPRNSSCGTGVFLPCGTSKYSEPRKKSRCSTVLIPARVAHALMLHFSKMGAPSISNGGAPPSFPTQQHDATLGGRKGQFFQEKGQITAEQSLNINDLGLPQEWMY